MELESVTPTATPAIPTTPQPTQDTHESEKKTTNEEEDHDTQDTQDTQDTVEHPEPEPEPETVSETDPAPEPESVSSSSSSSSPAPSLAPTCWICYDTATDDNPLFTPCDCRGSMSHVHEGCLMQWLEQSDTTTCPHCHCEYTLETTYPSEWHEWCDLPGLSTVVTVVVLAGLFYVFHMAFTWMVDMFRQHQSLGGGGLANLSPEMMSMVGSVVPGSRTVLSMLMNGVYEPPVGGLGGWLGKLNPTLLLVEAQLFALMLYGLYLLAKWWFIGGEGDNGDNTEEASDGVSSSPRTRTSHTPPPSSASSSASSPAASSTSPDSPSVSTTTPPSAPQPSPHWFHHCQTIVDTYWQETSIGSASQWSDEMLYVFPLDVLQTAFYAMEHGCRIGHREWVGRETHLVNRVRERGDGVA